MPQIEASSPVRALKGIGPAAEKALQKQGIFTVRDLLFRFPRAYEPRGNVILLKDGTNGKKAAFKLTVQTVPRQVKTKNAMLLLSFRAADESGSVEVVFFNRKFIAGQFEIGRTYRFWGALHHKGGRWQLSSPDFEEIKDGVVLADYVPVYPLGENISRTMMMKWTSEAISAALGSVEDILPEEVRLKHRLPTIAVALREIHRPQSEQSLKNALRRATFDELFCMALGISLSKSAHRTFRVPSMAYADPAPLLKALPYELTGAQKRAVNDMYRDMTKKEADGKCPPMRRILIGDVGSGKTICAAIAAFLTVKNGKQCALMVPTEILATQHYKDFLPLFEALGYKVRLLTGSTPLAQKREIYRSLAQKEDRTDIVIGTHALLSDKVAFDDLGLIITDEQHRFGVLQRAKLKERNEESHLLVMSATPIPRSLALVLYGDLSLSRIDEMPKGRQRVDTFAVGETYRARLFAFMDKQVKEGGQVYVVCPSIVSKEAENEEIENEVELRDLFFKTKEAAPPLKDATSYAKHLQEKVFPHLRIALLHGKMKQAEKDATMAEFALGNIDILVSTTVIEVGVNVPNATLMVVENAERFGLSQLHQLRGRVGRGLKKSYCILLSESKSETAQARLSVMASCYDGYEIAEKDLLLRGPGDFFAFSDDAVRQSGGFSTTLANLCAESELLSEAFEAAGELSRLDPTLQAPEHAALAKEVQTLFCINEATVS
ncbi:MAG: ATP-dependent DNA helicase RecG [Clostridia bacterium]|nr:ATP-dependent DNA helicase RecG [Clostridia bacterium]